MTYRVELEPREGWRLRVDVIPATDGMRTAAQLAERRFGDELARVRASLAAWQLRVPQLRGSWDDLTHSFRRSVADLSSLRMDEDTAPLGQLPAAGMPWFMTVFGRDTLITCLQTLLFGPELAQNALAMLAELQAREDDPEIDAEPGKIVHEVRHGKGAEAWFPRYYGTRRRDAALPHPPLRGLALDGRRGARPRPPRAGAARARVDRRATATSTATASSSTSAARRAGSSTSRGRTPATRSSSTTGGSPRRRSRRARCRATSTTRSSGSPSSRARSGASASWPSGSSGRRRSCAQRFDEAFWCEARGGYYALALDAEQAAGRLADARTSATCSGAASSRPHARRRGRRPADGRGALVGLGRAHDVRRRRRLQPARVPQRHGLAARQLADRLGSRALRALAGGAADHPADAERRLATSTTSCRRSSPASLARRRRSRSRTRRPRGRRPGPRARRCCCSSSCSGSSPTGGGTCSARTRPRRFRPGRARSGSPGVRAFDKAWDVQLEDGRVTDRIGVRIALSRPVWFPVPPTGYGGIEWVVSLLADGLADAGHDVTLFASGDSSHEGRARVRSSPRRRPSDIGRTGPELRHALACFERADEFDIVNDHSGPLAAALGGTVGTPVVHTVHGPLDGGRRRPLRAHWRGSHPASGSSRCR